MKTPIYDIVRKHFPEKEFALMEEVRDAAGFSASRSADYLAMNLWPSRGLSLHGIEQKSFRSDWIKERKQPQKAENIFKYCDYWWLLTTNDGVAKMEEIPEMWGWIHVVKGKIKIIKQAPKLSPCQIDKGFLAAMLKRATSKEGFIRTEEIREEIRKVKEQAESAKNYRLDRLEESNKTLVQQFEEFRKYTGIDIGNPDRWRQPNMEKIGGIVNALAKNGVDDLVYRMETLRNSCNNILKTVDENINEIKKYQEFNNQ